MKPFVESSPVVESPDLPDGRLVGVEAGASAFIAATVSDVWSVDGSGGAAVEEESDVT